MQGTQVDRSALAVDHMRLPKSDAWPRPGDHTKACIGKATGLFLAPRHPEWNPPACWTGTPPPTLA